MIEKHTLGPWGAVGPNGLDIRDCAGRPIAKLRPFLARHLEIRLAEAQANARLIAAAPDLLGALEMLMKAERMQGGARGGEIMGAISLAIDAARAAIAKAKGGEP